ncbi:alpha/beta hydrolase-fold protein [Corynebacterium sp.]|uniref:enterochelin esterase domain-containing protein n=1 Tax=Corynebacterium sp. TaxID=1720 RepID=UPI0025BAC1F7|nr:alpha/beta hydrolase-fold protein [Corynebacterium sp.]
MLITFTWAAPTDMPGVDRVHLHVTGVHDHHDPDFHRMVRVGDRWEASVEVPEDLVGSYRIMPVTRELAAQLDAEPDSRVRWMTVVRQTVTHVLDHLAWHPADWSEGFGKASGRLVMPEAPEQCGWDPADRPEWQAASLDGRPLWSADLTDAEYVLVLSDGRNWAATALPAALRRLHAAGRLPRTGVVAVDTFEERYELLTRSTEYRELIADRVIPWAWEQVGAAHDPTVRAQRTVISGESLGGLSAVDLVLTRPDAVANAVSTSGSFWYPAWDSGQAGGEVAAEIRERTAAGTLPEGIRVHLSAGTGEGRPGAGGTTMADHIRAVQQALLDAGVPATCEISTHGHEMAGWTGALTRGLVELLGNS